ncbi:MAG TPA: AlkA N-terminal domain-containing protein [Candidatus Binatia bacterium]|nr:AlkA N-terminal domain-containing protein [Candidatus Binatia bacterium]
MRTKAAGSPARGGSAVERTLPFKSPYDWPSIIEFYRSHSIPGVEHVADGAYSRMFRINHRVGAVRVRACAGRPALRVRITPDDPAVIPEVLRRVRKMFDTDCDPMVIVDRLSSIPLLAALCRRSPGLRVARGWDLFETGVCTILGQLVSTQHRTNLIGQLVTHYGEEIRDPLSEKCSRLFPAAETLALSDLSAVRTTAARREAIRDFSRRVLNGAISLHDGQDPAAFRRALLETKGLGPWSAEYISLRAIGDPDSFPKTDLILKRVLAHHPNMNLAPVKPWRSYAAIYLWKEFAQRLSKGKGKRA